MQQHEEEGGRGEDNYKDGGNSSTDDSKYEEYKSRNKYRNSMISMT